MNKLKLLIIPLLYIFGIFLYNQKIKASTNEYFEFQYHDGIYYTHTGGGFFFNDKFATYTMDGKTVYCIEPYANLGVHNYIGEEGFINSPFSDEINKKIELIGHYGYDYPNHQTLKYRMATQALIWETVDGHKVTFYTEAFGYGDVINVDYERNQIMSLVNSHYNKPSFQAQNLDVILNKPIEIEDTSGVLSDYEVYNANGNDVSINGNKLTITPKTIGSSKITFVRSRYDNATIFIYSSATGNYQKLAFFRSSDPSFSYINLNVIGGKIMIKKVDSESNLTIPQGQASLIGAKYQILDKHNNVVETLTIGNDSTATSDYLNQGTYKIKEISSSTGYLVDDIIYTVEINSSDTQEVIVKEKVIKGRIKITKQDSETNTCTSQGQASLIGAKYQVSDWNNNVVDTLTIGNDCTATSKELVYGNYKIKEINSSVGYEIDTNIYNVAINNSNIVNVISKEKVIKGRIKITKQDSETNTCTSQGQSTLVGAKYQVLDWNNNVVDTLTIGNDCTAISKYLLYGNYKIKEINSSVGYYLDKNVYNANITEDNIINITSKEEVIKNYISILKQYDYVDGTTQFLNAESNVTFEIFYSDGTKYGEVTTDRNGYATLEIPYGVWKFHQVNSKIGFEKIYDFYITVDENSEKEQYYNILNNKLSAYLQVFKTDSETGKTIALANTTFKILNVDTNQYVSQFVGGKVLDKFYTDENGVMVTYLKLESGNYKLIEIASPNGYLINSDGLDFSIGDNTHFNYTTYGAIVTVSFKNTSIKGQLKIAKKGENFIINDNSFYYDEKILKGIEFKIYATEDILSSDKNYLFYNKGDLVDTIITDDFGYAISKELPLGKYYVVETKTLDNYILNEEKYYFELTEVDNKTAVVYEFYNTFNYLKKGKLEFTKTDISTSKPLPNTKIEIYTDKDELIFSGETDENGKIIIDNLVLGKYYIVEKTSSTGYIKTNDKVYFEIKENGEIVKTEMTNKPITSDLEITKIDISTSESLPNATIEIYTEDEQLVFTGITDKDGKIVLKNLRYGKYYIMEKEAPIGYVLNDDKVYFEILEDGKIIKSTVTNEKIKGKLEFMKVDISTSEPLPNTTIEIYTEDDELIFAGITDKDGKIVIEELEFGKYYILEKQALTEYTLNTEKMYFEIKENGEIIKSTMTNEKIKSLIKIHKVDENGKSLVGVTIGIYDIEDNLIYEGITDENGYIETQLEYGKYYYKEIATIDGYIISEEKVEFEIVNNNEILEYTLINNIEEVDVPDTEKNRNIILDVLLSSLIFIGIGLVLYAKKNIKK